MLHGKNQRSCELIRDLVAFKLYGFFFFLQWNYWHSQNNRTSFISHCYCSVELCHLFQVGSSIKVDLQLSRPVVFFLYGEMTTTWILETGRGSSTNLWNLVGASPKREIQDFFMSKGFRLQGGGYISKGVVQREG